VVEVAPERGSFTVRIDAFEDAGACWELGYEEVGRFQFDAAAAVADDRRLAALRESAARFGAELTMEPDPGARRAALAAVAQRRAALRGRFDGLAVDVGDHVARREGDPVLYALVGEILAEHGLASLERALTTDYVTNPRAGEVVKGHLVVLAELGFAPYRGPAPRGAGVFAGEHSRERRAEHLLWRLALTQELWTALGHPEVTVFRAAASEGALAPDRPATLVSATFSREVAEAHFAGGPTTRSAALWRRVVPVERLLMTFLETGEMNRRYLEAEAVLLGPML
jgi:hypothetical protein